MKHLFLFSLLTWAICCYAQPKNTIEGRIDGLKKGDRIVLATGTLTETPVPTDSTIVTRDGSFTLKTTASDTYACLLVLKPGETPDPKNSPSAGFFLEGYAKIKAEGSAEDWRYFTFSGGLYDLPQMKIINSITNQGKETQKAGIKLLNAATAYAGQEGHDKDSLKILRDKGMALIKESNTFFRQLDPLNRDFIKNNPDVAYSAELLHYDYETMKDFSTYQSAFKALSARVQSSPAGKVVANYIVAKKATETGAPAPLFALEDIDGKMLRLSDLRGKYVLVDFWGTWCGPCRASTPRLVELYGKLKDKNFEIVSIATDERNDDYWRKIVKDDKMTWRHLNDGHSPKGKEIRSAYAVMGVPACFLIGPDGKIVLKGHPSEIHKQVNDVVAAAWEAGNK